jgi:hypothetical protein
MAVAGGGVLASRRMINKPPIKSVSESKPQFLDIIFGTLSIEKGGSSRHLPH